MTLLKYKGRVSQTIIAQNPQSRKPPLSFPFMIQNKGEFSRIALIVAIALAIGGLLYVKKAVHSIPAKPAPEEIVQVTEVRSLPGQLDNIPLFNSDNPEWVKKEGILLSTQK
jgi:hypothetical protein